MPKFKAREVARYFLGTVDEESGDNITNLKLQKLLYYAQGLYIAMNDEALFEEPIEAWDLGPVVPNVYHDTKLNQAQPIPRPKDFDPADYPPEIREFLDAVMSAYGQFSAGKLLKMTHRELPWRETYQSNRNVEIDLEVLQGFFSKVVEAGRCNTAVDGEPVWPIGSFRFLRRSELSRKLAPHREQLKAVARRAPSPDPIMADDEDY